MESKYLLSICIPTWNRARFLRKSLDSFVERFFEIEADMVELIVSDNCSDDDTESVVQEYTNKGLPIRYNRNEQNIGADGNFLKCMGISQGKYIFLLGDDDVLVPGSLKLIVDILKSGDFGLVHIHKHKYLKGGIYRYNDINKFVSQVSYWITFMSANIFLKEAVDKIAHPEYYLKTNLLQVPFYIESSILREENLIVSKSIITPMDNKGNGGYNFYKVFLRNYLEIWNSYRLIGNISSRCYQSLKRKLLFGQLLNNNWTLLVLHKNVAAENKDGRETRDGYIIEGAWKMLFKYYGKNLYFYFSLLIMPLLVTYRLCKTNMK
ncbi:MAG: glycosyltransferase family 2 protein [Prevotellaceae bacterium]|nr:glycosyltransferase family 2 protein [Candidatus Faecinaster equi]